MSVGMQPSKSEIDSRAGQVGIDFANLFDKITRLKAWLDATPDATLTASPFNYTPGEVAILKSAIADLAQLISIYNGAANLPTAKDFRTFVKQLTGIGI